MHRLHARQKMAHARAIGNLRRQNPSRFRKFLQEKLNAVLPGSTFAAT